jgi:uncharacterized protein YggT (Ycf19 family)
VDIFRVFQILILIVGFMTWTLVGQGALALLIWPNRRQNAIYRLFSAITWPAWRVARALSPRFVSDAQAGFVAFLLLILLRFGLYFFFYSQGWIPSISEPARP